MAVALWPVPPGAGINPNRVKSCSTGFVEEADEHARGTRPQQTGSARAQHSRTKLPPPLLAAGGHGALADVGNAREQLTQAAAAAPAGAALAPGLDYLVGAEYSPSADQLWLMAGNNGCARLGRLHTLCMEATQHQCCMDVLQPAALCMRLYLSRPPSKLQA